MTLHRFQSEVAVLSNDGAGGLTAGDSTAAGSDPVRLAAGDVDADGNLDVVTADRSADGLRVLFGDGAGAFSSVTSLATEPEPCDVAIADVDEDGDRDVATLDLLTAGAVRVLLNDGAGGFPTVVGPYATGPFPTDLVVGDPNGDGHPDLIATNGASEYLVAVLLGDGTGAFAPPVRFGTDIDPAAVAVADLDGDLKPELLSANSFASTVGVHANRSITFGPWEDLGNRLAGSEGFPRLVGAGPLLPGTDLTVTLSDARPASTAHLFVGAGVLNAPFLGGTIVPNPAVTLVLPTGPTGGFTIPATLPPGTAPGLSFVVQAWVADPAGVAGAAASNGLRGEQGERPEA